MDEVSGNYLTNVSSLSSEVNVVRRLTTDSERLLYLEALLCAYVTNGVAENEYFQQLRNYFATKFDTKGILPRWLKTFKSLPALWEFLRFQGSTPEARRSFIQEALIPLKDYLSGSEHLSKMPTPLAETDQPEVTPTMWTKAKEECWDNPDGAATMAAMAFETELNSLLSDTDFDENSPAYTNLGLYARYQELVKRLGLHPGLQSTVSFGSLLDGLAEIVSGLDLLSSEIGERSEDRLSPGQAELTVNLASAISEYLAETAREVKELEE
ncbi:MAG: hypothetical protein KC422_06365 [Trueperaceae bacterium]|nr:hypothetical protein [Trueperaceae bacterium]